MDSWAALRPICLPYVMTSRAGHAHPAIFGGSVIVAMPTSALREIPRALLLQCFRQIVGVVIISDLLSRCPRLLGLLSRGERSICIC